MFIARELGPEAYRASVDLHDYGSSCGIREIAARNKDFFLSKFVKPKPTFLGDSIPVFGNGRATDGYTYEWKDWSVVSGLIRQ